MVDVRTIDNHAVREQQVTQLERLKAERDNTLVKDQLARLIDGAKSNANLLSLSIDAMRARATVGEVSAALENVFGRHTAEVSTVSGVYKSAFGHENDVKDFICEVEAFEKRHGRRPRILVTKLGQDGHDRGAKVVATAFADLGFDVDVAPLFLTPQEAARQAIENDVHVVGVSTLAAGHKTLVPELIRSLKEQGASDILVVVGGVVPPQDEAFLHEQGVAAVFGPGTPILTSARSVLEKLF